MTQATHPDASAPVANALSYASLAPPRTGPRAWAGAAILAAGVTLVGLGGCFLIGVLCIIDPAAFGFMTAGNQVTDADICFLCVLYFAAFTCFGGAVTLLFLGTRGLLRVMRGSQFAAQ